MLNTNAIHKHTGWAKSRCTVIILYTVYLLLAHLLFAAVRVMLKEQTHWLCRTYSVLRYSRWFDNG